MKKIINKITIVLLMAFAAACVDESLDPVKFNEVKKATILALRGDSFDNLNNTGCVSSFFKNSLVNGETFSVDADYLAEDQESLQEVQLFASILTTTSKGLTARPRTLVTTTPGSAFTFPADSKTKRGNVSATRAAIIAALNIAADSLVKLGTNDITMDMDLVLTDGSKVLASSIVNPNLFQSVIFYPAMVLAYCANDAADFAPQATTSMLGEYSKNATTGVITRTVVPLKSGVSDSLFISYDQAEIITPPTVSFSPASGGTAGAVTIYKAKKNQFYVIYTAGATYTGAVTATVTGATADVAGVVLVQDSKKQTINVDNTAPVRTSTSTGTRIGVGQFVTIVVNFNEALSTKSANAIKVTIDGTALGLEDVTDASMTVASNGLSASLIYIFKLADPLVPATHGNLVVDFTTDAKDVAGNATVIPDGSLTVDVNAPPAPLADLSILPYDLGTQLRWRWTQLTDGTNPNGAVTGVVHFIAIDEALSTETAIPGPTSVSFDADLIPTWVMPEDPNSTEDPKDKVAIRQQGAVVVTLGASGTTGTLTTIYTPFTANRAEFDDLGNVDPLDDVTRGFNIYAVFRGSTGNVSAITLVPQATVVMK